MKAVNYIINYYGAVRSSMEVTIEATEEETAKLREALKIVDKWKRLTRKAILHKEESVDFTMYEFAVKKDKVFVTVDSGACG